MSAKCPCCHQLLQDEKFYIRWFDHTKGMRRLWHGVFGAEILSIGPATFRDSHGVLNAHINGKAVVNGVIVGLQTGIIYRNNSTKALPKFVTEPLLRAAIAAGAELPPIYKKDRKKPTT